MSGQIDSAKHSALQHLSRSFCKSFRFSIFGQVILQIILLFNIRVDDSARHSAFNIRAGSLRFSVLGQMILQIHATIQDTGRFEKLCKRIDYDLERSRHAHSIRE
jgi:hypothetical protein